MAPPDTGRDDRGLPSVFIIGAMKAATSTLHDQLAAQPGMVMSAPKEPNFFGDDAAWARGLGWYRSLFESAGPGDLLGESSTHYAKLPDHPDVVARLTATIPDPRIIYVMRHPVDRLVSHFIHEWTMGEMGGHIDDAVTAHPALVDYGRYAMQLRPWLAAVGPDRVLPVFFDRLTRHPQAELERIGRFLGRDGMRWVDLPPDNVSSQRLRRSAARDALVNAPGLSQLRQRLPRRLRDRVKRRWQMTERPTLGTAAHQRIEATFDQDLAELGRWLGISLSCATFAATADVEDPSWTVDAPAHAAGSTSSKGMPQDGLSPPSSTQR